MDNSPSVDPARKQILLLSAAMGGGHLQIAHELRRRLVERGHEAVVVDMLEVMPRPFGRFLHWVYPWLVNRTPRLYQHVYETFFAAEQEAGERVGIPVHAALPGLRRLVEDLQPDLAVSTYPLCSLALGELRASGDLSCPAVTVVTTFSLNNVWLHPAVDAELCISTDAAEETEARIGRPARVSGPIVRPGFGDARGGAVAARLGLPDSTHLVVVSTGSMGLSGAAVSAARTVAAMPGFTPVVLCGRNTSVRQQVEEVDGALALDWVEDMPGLYADAEVLVDNNCGMAAKEALAAGLPVVTYRPLTGHGRDDAAAMARLGLTEVVEEPEDLAAAVRQLVEDPALRARRVALGRDLFVADAAEQLLEHVESPLLRR